MTQEEVFLLEILENRDDDTPRRIYADWLIDTGEPVSVARGEFIHLQCDSARLPPCTPRPSSLVRRERSLLESHGKEWGSLFQRVGCYCWEYRRGFIEGIGVPGSVLLSQATLLFRTSPIREVKLYQAADQLKEIGTCTSLSRVCTLDLEKNELGDYDLQALAESPHLSNLETLLLWSNRIGEAGISALTQASCPQLKRLDLSNNAIGDPGLTALSRTPLLSQIQLLDLAGNQISTVGALALARSPFINATMRLDLTKNPIDALGANVLRERFGNRVQIWG